MSIVAYSIGKSKRYDIKQDSSFQTGPGTYQATLVDKKNEPKWTMGSRTLINLNKSVGPGPTAYEIPSKVFESPGKTMGTRPKQDLNSTMDQPGPGQYVIDKKEQRFAFTMGKRYSTLDTKMKAFIPGPGQYDSQQKLSVPQVKFGTGSRSSLDSPLKRYIPGPGQYTGQIDNVIRSAPKYGFGTGLRENSLERLNKFKPGPGQYDQLSVMGKEGPSKSIAGRVGANLEEKELRSKPGPGQYEPNHSAMLKNSPGLKMGTALRDDLAFKKQNEFKPSPTIYNPKDSFTKTHNASWGFGSGKRPSIDQKTFSTPAPGTYVIPSRTAEGPSYVMGSRTKDVINENRDKVPGPGQYEINNSTVSGIKNEPSFSMGSGQRADIGNSKQRNHIPGPGQYGNINEASQASSKSAPKFGFGTGNRDDIADKKNNGQGPGAYEIKSLIGNEGKKNSISPKIALNYQEKESRNKPGPGSYDNSDALLKQQPAYKMGTSKRTESVPKERLNYPDATRYDPNESFTKTQSAAWGFGSSSRKSLDDSFQNKVPGPGQYQLNNSSPYKFAMGVKLKDLSKIDIPGPGQYDQNANAVVKTMPAFSISGKTNGLKKDQIPGPGEYQVPAKAQEGPKFGFGTSIRDKKLKDEIPGPGHYKVPVKLATLPQYALPNAKDDFKYV